MLVTQSIGAVSCQVQSSELGYKSGWYGETNDPLPLSCARVAPLTFLHADCVTIVHCIFGPYEIKIDSAQNDTATNADIRTNLPRYLPGSALNFTRKPEYAMSLSEVNSAYIFGPVDTIGLGI